MGGGDAKGARARGGAGELARGEVVVDDAVGGHGAPALPGRVVGRAVAVEPLRPDVGDVDVELAVRPVVSRGDVRAGRAVAEAPHLDAPDRAEDRACLVDVVGDAVPVPVTGAGASAPFETQKKHICAPHTRRAGWR